MAKYAGEVVGVDVAKDAPNRALNGRGRRRSAISSCGRRCPRASRLGQLTDRVPAHPAPARLRDLGRPGLSSSRPADSSACSGRSSRDDRHIAESHATWPTTGTTGPPSNSCRTLLRGRRHVDVDYDLTASCARSSSAGSSRSPRAHDHGGCHGALVLRSQEHLTPNACTNAGTQAVRRDSSSVTASARSCSARPRDRRCTSRRQKRDGRSYITSSKRLLRIARNPRAPVAR